MIKELTKGIFRENPVLMLLLGLCPTLGVSGKFFNAIGMGLGVIFVLVCFIGFAFLLWFICTVT